MRYDHPAPLCAAITLAASFTIGCAAGPRTPESAAPVAQRERLQGTATYAEHIDMPNDAIFEATLLDVSRLDAPGTAVGYTVIVSPSRVPIAFAISFDTAMIDPARNYAVRTRIVADGRPLWISDRAYPVLTQGAGHSVNVLMRRTGSADNRTPADSVVELSGELTYVADVARITECSSRRLFPVSTEADFPALLRTYLELAHPPGRPLYVTFDGMIANRLQPTGVGVAATVVVRDFIGAWPNQNCTSSLAAPVLLSTPWRITVLNGVRLTKIPGHEQAQLELQRDSSGTRYSATVGCNGIAGDVTITADNISFGPGTGTMKSCGTPLDSLEHQLRQVLDRAATWQIRSNTLRLRDEAGVTIALFEPRTLR